MGLLISVGKFHSHSAQSHYQDSYRRVHFAMDKQTDDGARNPAVWTNADIILVGVSRLRHRPPPAFTRVANTAFAQPITPSRR